MIDIVLVISLSGEILYANRSALEFYQFSEAEILQKTIFEFRRDDSRTLVLEQLGQAFRHGIEFETVHYKKTGKAVPVKSRAVALGGCEEKCILSVIQDVSKFRKYASRAKILDASLDITEEAIVVLDAEFCVTIWNKAAEMRFGYSGKEIIGKRIDFLVPKDKQNEVEIVIKLLKMGQSIDRIETQRVHRDGHRIDISVSYAPILDMKKAVMGYIGIYADISEIKILNQKAKECQERASLALDGGKITVWEIDQKNGSLKLHNNMEKQLGYEEGEIGEDLLQWRALIHSEDKQLLMQTLQQLTDEQQSFEVEFRIQTKANDYNWLQMKGKVIELDKDSRLIRMIGTCENIHARRKNEQEILEKNIELERLIKEAERANETKSLFLANMSHEIRTPLNGILATVQLLQKTEPNKQEQNKLFGILEFSAKTLQGIVTDILDISKVEQEKTEIIKSVFSLKDMMQSTYNDLQVQANTKGIEAGYFFDPNLDKLVFGDVQKMQQIINNLISNAIKFTETGYISLKTKLVEENSDSLLVEIEVKDSGIGIGKEDQEKIFCAFTQLDDSSNKKYAGTGLGLAICSKYAELLGGEVNCASKKGVGSTFHFRCPLEQVNQIRTVSKKQKELNLNKVVTNEHLNKTVLSVDDNFVNQSVVEYIIEKMGLNFRAAYHAEETMDILNKETVDLILIDIQLPRINGYRLTEMIRNQEEFRTIPIIAMTAYSRVEDRQKCLNAGMNEFIVKPIDIEKLESMIIDKLKL